MYEFWDGPRLHCLIGAGNVHIHRTGETTHGGIFNLGGACLNSVELHLRRHRKSGLDYVDTETFELFRYHYLVLNAQ